MNCPSHDEISAYLAGKLPEGRFQFVAGHLDGCARCESVASELDGRSNSIRLPCLAVSADGQLDLGVGPQPEFLLESLEKARQVGREDTPGAADETRRIANSETQIRQLLARCAPTQAPDEAGRFEELRILDVLGCGGMGVVFRGEDLALRRPVAVKFLQSTSAIPSSQERFLREARAAAAVSNEHVLAVYRVGEVGGVPFLVMPLLKGISLRDRLLAEPGLPLAEVLRIGRETATGLSAAHRQGLLHRDIKPDNLWLDSEANRVVILDFGLARPMHPSVELTSSNVIVGTPRYMSPEQALGHAVDHRCDLFSLGCVLYQMAAGRVPFMEGSVTRTLIAIATEDPVPLETQGRDLPQSFCLLVQRLLAKDPRDRYQAASDVVAAIRAVEKELIAGDAVFCSSKQSAPADRKPRWPSWMLAGSAALCLLLLLGFGLASQGNRETRRTAGRQESVRTTSWQDVAVKPSEGKRQRKQATNGLIPARRLLKPADGWLPLIPLVDPTAADLQGAFTVDDEVLVSAGTRTLLQFPLRIDGEYDFEATIAKWFIKDNHHIDLYMPFGNERYPFFRIGIDDTNTGTGCSFRASEERAPRVKLPFSSGDKVRLSLHLRRAGKLLKTSAEFDGRYIASCTRLLDEGQGERPSGQLLLLDLMKGREYRDLRLRMVSGEAEILTSISAGSGGGD